MKNIYLIVTDEVIEGISDLRKLEEAEFATITDLNTSYGWETYNGTLAQKGEALPYVESCFQALSCDGLLEEGENENK